MKLTVCIVLQPDDYDITAATGIVNRVFRHMIFRETIIAFLLYTR